MTTPQGIIILTLLCSKSSSIRDSTKLVYSSKEGLEFEETEAEKVKLGTQIFNTIYKESEGY